MGNQESMNHRRWWQGWFKDWSLCGQSGVDSRRAAIWTGIFCLLFALGSVFLDAPAQDSSVSIWYWLLALSPIIPGVMAIIAWRHFMKNAEDLLRQIYFESAANAFCVSLVVFFSLGVVGRVFGDSQGREALILAFCLMVFVFCASLLYRIRKYND